MRLGHLKARHAVGLGAAAAMAFAVTGIAAAATGTVTNGAFFLTGATSAYTGSFETVCAGQTNITGWTITNGSVDVIGTYWENAIKTTNSLDMNGTPGNCPSTSQGRTEAAATISQTFSTAIDATYVVQFWFAGNPTLSSSPQTKVLQVSATGATSQTYTFSTTGKSPTNMGWVTEAYTFVATSTSTTLTFAATPTNTSLTGPAIEDVTVTDTLAKGADCKTGGWKSMVNATTGQPFKNQGACVSYFATNGTVPIGK